MAWKIIEAYQYPYRISEEGEVQRQLPNGAWRTMNPEVNRRYAMITVVIRTGVYRKISVTSLMEGRWVPRRKPGEVFRHRNGAAADCSARNLELTTQAGLARRLKGPGRRPVAKIDRAGEIVELYRSIRAAAEANHVDRKCVTNRCMGKIREPFALTGYSFRYER